MITGTTYSPVQLQEVLAKTFTGVQELFTSLNEEQINRKPDYGGWSAGQVLDHLTRSNRSITKALRLSGSQINRDPSEKVSELRDIFLDFGKKFESPDFILPSSDHLHKEDVTSGYQNSCRYLLETVSGKDLSAMINHPAFGDITKLEILHFVLFHTVRHNRQIENIIKSFIQN